MRVVTKINHTENARSLRKRSTPMETKLWNYLRSRRWGKLKFRRQRPVGRYIVDFICLEKKIIIEIDGAQHNERKDYDNARTDFLNQLGFKVIRFWNNEVAFQFKKVMERLCLECV